MPQVVVPLVAAVAKAGVVAIIKRVAFTIITNVLLGKLSKALAGKKKGATGISPQLVTVRDTTPHWSIVYGEVRTGGTVVYYTTTGTNNNLLWYVIAVAGHQCESITDVWIDNELIQDSWINSSTGVISTGRFAGYVKIWKKLGTSAQTAETNLDGATSEWGSNHRGKGIAHVVIQLTLNADVFPNGAPQNFFFRVRGKRVYDPRLDSTNGGSGSHRLNNATTWAWSANPALCAADYLTGGSRWYDVSTPDNLLGLRVPTADVDWTLVASAANTCDETPAIPGPSTQTRYVLGAVFTTDMAHEQILEAITESMAAPLPIPWGDKYRIFAGRYTTPSVTVTDADLINEGYEIIGGTAWKDRFNAVTAEYVDPNRDWQFVSCAMQTDAAYETEDGRRVVRTLQLEGVTNEFRAQRIANLRKLQSRSQVIVKLYMGLNGLRLTPWETFNLTLLEEGWTNKVFRVLEVEFNLANRQTTVTGIEDSSASWADLSTFGTAPTGTSGIQATSPDNPSNFRVQGTTDGINFRWSLPPNLPTDVMSELWEHTSASPRSSATLIWRGRDSQAFIEKADTTTRYYWLELAGAYGNRSSTFPAGNGLPGAAAAITTGFRATVSNSTPTGSTINNTTVTTDSTTASPVNGASPYTYAWTQISGDANWSISNATAATTAFTHTSSTLDTVFNAVFRCTITDNASATATVDVNASVLNSSEFPP